MGKSSVLIFSLVSLWYASTASVFPTLSGNWEVSEVGDLEEYPVNFSFTTTLNKLNSKFFISSDPHNLKSIINKNEMSSSLLFLFNIMGDNYSTFGTKFILHVTTLPRPHFA